MDDQLVQRLLIHYHRENVMLEVVMASLIAVLLVKIYVFVRDEREWRKLNDRERSKP